jgi:hypothetical protein
VERAEAKFKEIAFPDDPKQLGGSLTRMNLWKPMYDFVMDELLIDSLIVVNSYSGGSLNPVSRQLYEAYESKFRFFSLIICL